MEQPSKRRRILDASVEIFSRYGFYNSKVSQVAKAAGVADGTIYLYFKNKEALLIQVFEDTMEEGGCPMTRWGVTVVPAATCPAGRSSEHRNKMESNMTTTDVRIPQVRDGCAQRPCGEFS